MHGRAGERRERDERRGDVRRLGVVDVERRRRPSATSSRRCVDAARTSRSAVAHGVGVDPAREADGRRGHRVVRGCARRAARSSSTASSGSSAHHSCPARSASSAPGADAEADPPRAAAEVLDAEPDRRDRDVVVALAARRPAASPRGRPRTCRGGRGGRAARLSSTARLGRERDVSSSWNDEASQTTIASGSSAPTSELTRRADVARDGHRHARPRGGCGRSARSSSSCRSSRSPRRTRSGSSRQASSSSPSTGMPARARRRDDRRLGRHARAT